jgi:hypothetical protein
VLKEPAKTFAYLLMGKEFAVVQRGLASLYGFNEAIFFGEVARHNILDNFAEVAPMFAGTLREARFEIRSEVDFHSLTIL